MLIHINENQSNMNDYVLTSVSCLASSTDIKDSPMMRLTDRRESSMTSMSPLSRSRSVVSAASCSRTYEMFAELNPSSISSTYCEKQK